jgi:hypothetical protein
MQGWKVAVFLLSFGASCGAIRRTGIAVGKNGALEESDAESLSQATLINQLSEYNKLLLEQVEGLKAELAESNKVAELESGSALLEESDLEEEGMDDEDEDFEETDAEDEEYEETDAEDEDYEETEASTPFEHKVKWVLNGAKEKKKKLQKPLWNAVGKKLKVSANGITKAVAVEKGGADGKGLSTAPASQYTAFLKAKGIPYKAVAAYTPKCGFTPKKTHASMHELSWAVWTPACKNKAIRIVCEPL